MQPCFSFGFHQNCVIFAHFRAVRPWNAWFFKKIVSISTFFRLCEPWIHSKSHKFGSFSKLRLVIFQVVWNWAPIKSQRPSASFFVAVIWIPSPKWSKIAGGTAHKCSVFSLFPLDVGCGLMCGNLGKFCLFSRVWAHLFFLRGKRHTHMCVCTYVYTWCTWCIPGYVRASVASERTSLLYRYFSFATFLFGRNIWNSSGCQLAWSVSLGQNPLSIWCVGRISLFWNLFLFGNRCVPFIQFNFQTNLVSCGRTRGPKAFQITNVVVQIELRFQSNSCWVSIRFQSNSLWCVS